MSQIHRAANIRVLVKANNFRDADFIFMFHSNMRSIFAACTLYNIPYRHNSLYMKLPDPSPCGKGSGPPDYHAGAVTNGSFLISGMV